MLGNTLTLAGNLTATPELTFTDSGTAKLTFTVAQTERRYDAQKGEYVDGNTTFARCVAWNRTAEGIADSDLRKGTRVIVVGALRENRWQDNEGNNRSMLEVVVEELGASMRSATVRVTRVSPRPPREQATAAAVWGTSTA